MKIIQLGNVNYFNYQQQNFGMKLDFDEAAVKLLHPIWFHNVEGLVSDLKTRRGEELTVKGTGKGQKIELKFPDCKKIYTIVKKAKKNMSVELLTTLRRINSTYI